MQGFGKTSTNKTLQNFKLCLNPATVFKHRSYQETCKYFNTLIGPNTLESVCFALRNVFLMSAGYYDSQQHNLIMTIQVYITIFQLLFLVKNVPESSIVCIYDFLQCMFCKKTFVKIIQKLNKHEPF